MAEKNEVVVQEEKKEVVAHNNKVTDYSLGIFGTSDNFVMAMNNSSNCLIAIEQAQRMKVSPMMVMQNLYPIQGKPCWSAQFLIAQVNNSGNYDIELQYDEKQKNGKPFSCQCWTMKAGRRIDGMVVDMDMADAEGWTKKNGSKWKTMPQLMLRYRAASFFARLNCPEFTMGLYTKEELIDGDFKEYPLETMQEQVEKEISNGANSEDFESAAVEPEFMEDEE